MNPAFDLGVNYQKSPPEILHRFGKNDVRQGQYSTSYIPWTLDFEGGKMQHLPCSRCLLPKTELQKLCGKTSWGQHDKRFESGGRRKTNEKNTCTPNRQDKTWQIAKRKQKQLYRQMITNEQIKSQKRETPQTQVPNLHGARDSLRTWMALHYCPLLLLNFHLKNPDMTSSCLRTLPTSFSFRDRGLLWSLRETTAERLKSEASCACTARPDTLRKQHGVSEPSLGWSKETIYFDILSSHESLIPWWTKISMMDSEDDKNPPTWKGRILVVMVVIVAGRPIVGGRCWSLTVLQPTNQLLVGSYKSETCVCMNINTHEYKYVDIHSNYTVLLVSNIIWYWLCCNLWQSKCGSSHHAWQNIDIRLYSRHMYNFCP